MECQVGRFSKADLYRNISDKFEYKLYLDVITIEKFRIFLSRLRSPFHRLHIESGRWHTLLERQDITEFVVSVMRSILYLYAQDYKNAVCMYTFIELMKR